ncbi:HypC/HybG/HupF family hydrogenase formation chaperone [Sporichthya brevicatena]|uniref:HypC/HybG/HupF family hydrogenase formation chaperone n=1 Tax=Sporichthya brevicatena TaxID=171442 RepID=A0ABN1GNA7_9ACTN
MCLAVPGRITSIESGGGRVMADVDFVGESRAVCLDYLPDLAVGDYVIVHAGYALTRVTPEEAERTVGLMQEFGLLDEMSES